MGRLVRFSIAALGILFFVPGAVLLYFGLSGVQSGDDVVALTPLGSVPLDRIGSQHPHSLTVVIPDTAQWKRIRRGMGRTGASYLGGVVG